MSDGCVGVDAQCTLPVLRRLGELQTRIALDRVIDRPVGREDEKASSLVVLQQLDIGRQVQILEIGYRRFVDEPEVLIR